MYKWWAKRRGKSSVASAFSACDRATSEQLDSEMAGNTSANEYKLAFIRETNALRSLKHKELFF